MRISEILRPLKELSSWAATRCAWAYVGLLLLPFLLALIVVAIPGAEYRSTDPFVIEGCYGIRCPYGDVSCCNNPLLYLTYRIFLGFGTYGFFGFVLTALTTPFFVFRLGFRAGFYALLPAFTGLPISFSILSFENHFRGNFNDIGCGDCTAVGSPSPIDIILIIIVSLVTLWLVMALWQACWRRGTRFSRGL